MDTMKPLAVAAIALLATPAIHAAEAAGESAHHRRSPVVTVASRSAGDPYPALTGSARAAAGAESAARRPVPTISLSVRDADLVEVVRSLARIAGVNLVVDPAVRGRVTAELHEVPWDRALAVILKLEGMGMEIDGRLVTVAPPAHLLIDRAAAR